MEAFLSAIGAFFTQSITWFSDILNLATTEPALIIMIFAMPIVGFSVGLLRRMIRL